MILKGLKKSQPVSSYEKDSRIQILKRSVHDMLAKMQKLGTGDPQCSI